MSIMEDHSARTARRAQTPCPYVTGASAIGRELGCSGITIRRIYAKGLLRDFIYRSGKNTSPLRMLRIHIPKARAQLQEIA
jgi:Protein of unknown function (DUF3853)